VQNNIAAAKRVQLDYYGAARYDLAKQAVTADYVDHRPALGRPLCAR
jgi:hypothetical protein